MKRAMVMAVVALMTGPAAADEVDAARDEAREETRAAEAEIDAALDEAGLAPAPARAAVAEGLRLDLPVDLSLMAGLGGVYLGLFLGVHRNPKVLDDTSALVDPPGGIDRLGVLASHEGPAHVSDFLLYGGLGVGLVLAPLDGYLSGRSAWTRTVVYLETLVVVGALTEIAKWAVRRPRPYTFEAREGAPDDDLSFFSGHTSFTAAWAFSTARALDLDHTLTPLVRASLYGGATVLTVLVASLRVAAGKHWPSDVLAGAFVGGAVGYLVPELHRSSRWTVAAAPGAGGGIEVVAATRF